MNLSTAKKRVFNGLQDFISHKSPAFLLTVDFNKLKKKKHIAASFPHWEKWLKTLNIGICVCWDLFCPKKY